ncbi:hypothetical protein KBD34_05605 [Patescibacteria group bacterium]|nr:hypothetical protein [Patescibacteria group bacterium]
MNASLSLRTGWINVWIILGVFSLLLFVALPIAITRKASNEFARYQDCVSGKQRTNCEPSLVWALNGWGTEDGVMTGATSTRVVVTSTQDTLIKTLTLNGVSSLDRTEPLSVELNKGLTVEIETNDQVATKGSITIQIGEQSATAAGVLKQALTRRVTGEKILYTAQIQLPSAWRTAYLNRTITSGSFLVELNDAQDRLLDRASVPLQYR